MGRRNQAEPDNGEPCPLYLQRLRMIDGDYDTGGAYWGGTPGQPMWCAFSADLSVMIFTRAATREEAKRAVDEQLKDDGFTFFK